MTLVFVLTTVVLHFVTQTIGSCPCGECLDCNDPNCPSLGNLFGSCGSQYCGPDPTLTYKCYCIQPATISLATCQSWTVSQRLLNNKCYPNLECSPFSLAPPCNPNVQGSCQTGYDCIQTCCANSQYRCVQCCDSPTPEPVSEPEPQNCECSLCNQECAQSEYYFNTDTECGLTNDTEECQCIRPQSVSYQDCLDTTMPPLEPNKCYNNYKCTPVVTTPCPSGTPSDCPTTQDCMLTCCENEPYRCVDCCDNPAPVSDPTSDPIPEPTKSPAKNPTSHPSRSPPPIDPPSCSCDTCNKDCYQNAMMFNPDQATFCGDSLSGHACTCIRPESLSYPDCTTTPSHQLIDNKCYNNAPCNHPDYIIPCNPQQPQCPANHDCVQTCCENQEYRCVKCCDYPS